MFSLSTDSLYSFFNSPNIPILVLLFILFFVILYSLIHHLFIHQNRLSAIIAVLISLLAIVYLSLAQQHFINLILQLVGGILLSLLPIAFLFFVLHSFESSSFRRIIFFAYSLLYLFLSYPPTFLNILILILLILIILFDDTLHTLVEGIYEE